jgi:hypothetical protein
MEWNKACAKAGLRDFDEKTRTRGEEGGGRLQDCRCSGAVNLLRAGIDEGTVLKRLAPCWTATTSWMNGELRRD